MLKTQRIQKTTDIFSFLIHSVSPIILYLIIFLSASFSQNFAVIKVANVPAKALYLTQPKGDDSRLFILNQKGQIHIIQYGETLEKPFLDISDRVHSSLTPGSEEGLLGLAFHPDYFNNGFFYVNYVNKNDTSIVSRFSVTEDPEIANEESEKVLLESMPQ